jgi:hypothetical protein
MTHENTLDTARERITRYRDVLDAELAARGASMGWHGGPYDWGSDSDSALLLDAGIFIGLGAALDLLPKAGGLDWLSYYTECAADRFDDTVRYLDAEDWQDAAERAENLGPTLPELVEAMNIAVRNVRALGWQERGLEPETALTAAALTGPAFTIEGRDIVPHPDRYTNTTSTN